MFIFFDTEFKNTFAFLKPIDIYNILLANFNKDICQEPNISPGTRSRASGLSGMPSEWKPHGYQRSFNSRWCDREDMLSWS